MLSKCSVEVNTGFKIHLSVFVILETTAPSSCLILGNKDNMGGVVRVSLRNKGLHGFHRKAPTIIITVVRCAGMNRQSFQQQPRQVVLKAQRCINGIGKGVFIAIVQQGLPRVFVVDGVFKANQFSIHHAGSSQRSGPRYFFPQVAIAKAWRTDVVYLGRQLHNGLEVLCDVKVEI